MSSDKDSAMLVLICLAIMYTALTVLAIIRTCRVYGYLTITKHCQWFYIVICVESSLRTITFAYIVVASGNISWTSLFVLLSIPDSIFIIIYLLLLMILMIIYSYSHLVSAQDLSLVRKSSISRNKLVKIGQCMILGMMILQIASYSVYISDSMTSKDITTENAVLNVILSGIGTFFILYLNVRFSGLPIKSMTWKRNLRKINVSSVFWTAARFLKGIVDLFEQTSIINISEVISDPDDHSFPLLGSALCIGVMIISELICLFLVLDSAFLDMFVNKDEGLVSVKNLNLKKSMMKSNACVEEDEIQIIEELNYTKKSPLGKIYRAQYRDSVVFYRIMSFSRLSSYIIEEITNEIGLYRKLSVQTIVPILGIIFKQPTVGLVYPYYPKGSLFDLVHNSELQLPFVQKVQILKKVSEAVLEIHENHRYHGHLSPYNILLNSDLEIYISDLGFHKMKKYAGVMYGYSYKSPWSSPEILKEQKLSPSNLTYSDDSYSFGMICWEVLTSNNPFSGYGEKQLIESVVNQSLRPFIPKEIPDDITNLIKSCWNEDPGKRPEFSLIVLSLTKSLYNI